MNVSTALILAFICGVNIGFFAGSFFASTDSNGEDYETGFGDGYMQGLYANGYLEAMKERLEVKATEEGGKDQ